jgi:hypothetical protein
MVTGFLEHHRACLLVAARRAIAALAGDRLVRVAHGDDPRGKRDVLAAQAVWIPAPIPPLVAGTDDLRDRTQRRCGAQDALAKDRVLVDELPLAGVQHARLLEDRVGMPTLPMS